VVTNAAPLRLMEHQFATKISAALLVIPALHLVMANASTLLQTQLTVAHVAMHAPMVKPVRMAHVS
jgi:hypothetical protein